MQLAPNASVALAAAVRAGVGRLPAPARIVVCPSFPALPQVAEALRGSPVALGAQDLSWAEQGTYTGDVSAEMLLELGCRYALIGHSERRKNHYEDNDMVSRKFAQAFRRGLTPILCVGETFAERQAKIHERIVIEQVLSALQYLPPPSLDRHVYIAYEPVWVIGTGQAIEPDEARVMAEVIFQSLVDLFPLPVVRRNLHLLYGGSVNDRNVVNFIDGELVQGVLVGSASLDAQEFLAIAQAITRHAAQPSPSP